MRINTTKRSQEFNRVIENIVGKVYFLILFINFANATLGYLHNRTKHAYWITEDEHGWVTATAIGQLLRARPKTTFN